MPHPFQHIVADIQFASGAVKTVIRNTDDEIIPQFPGTPEKIDMTLMEKIICSVCDDFLHKLFSINSLYSLTH